MAYIPDSLPPPKDSTSRLRSRCTSRWLVRLAHRPFERQRRKPHHVDPLTLPHAVCAHRSLVHEPRSAGHRRRRFIVRLDRQEGASCAELEQPPCEQNHRPSRVPAPARARPDPVAELRYVCLRPVIDAAAADQATRGCVRDRECNTRWWLRRDERPPARRELVDDRFSMLDRERRSRSSESVVGPL